jgi:hypothetical protein
MALQKKKLTLAGKSIDVVEVPAIESREFFNEYTLEDGSKIKVKNVATSIMRVEGERNPDGTPIYLVLVGNVVSVVHGPEGLEEKS